MGDVLFVTGVTGALGPSLLEELAANGRFERIYALRHRSRLPTAYPKIRELDAAAVEKIAGEVTAILHAASETSFSTPLDSARRVNVGLTKHFLEFAGRCRRLRKFGFVSTTHVAGKRTGRILERELDHPAGFVNAYEQSKFEAEQMLRLHMNALPMAIYRMSTIFGDSRTGFVSKIGAVHHAMHLFYSSLAPMIPGTSESPVDLISLDYAAAALAHLFCERFEPGKTLHICAGAEAWPLEEMLTATVDCFLRERPAWRKRVIEKPAIVDLRTFELFERTVEESGNLALRQAISLIKHFAPQLAFPKRFDDAECARALAGSGIKRAPLREFYPHVIKYLVATNWGTRFEAVAV